MKYKIGKISKLIGISPQTIRYYEENGVVKPEKSDESGYRYYDVWQYAILSKVRMYLKYGFSVSEAVELLHGGDFSGIDELYATREEAMQQNLMWQSRMLAELRYWRALISRTEQTVGTCEIALRPGMFRFENMNDITMIEDKAYYDETKNWLEKMPFIFQTIRYTQEDVKNNSSHRISALGVLEENAGFLGIEANDMICYHPPRLCVHAVIGGRNFDTMLPLGKRIGFVLDYMRENGLELTGDIITRMVILRKLADGYLSYQNAWFPIQ